MQNAIQLSFFFRKELMARKISSNNHFCYHRRPIIFFENKIFFKRYMFMCVCVEKKRKVPIMNAKRNSFVFRFQQRVDSRTDGIYISSNNHLCYHRRPIICFKNIIFFKVYIYVCVFLEEKKHVNIYTKRNSVAFRFQEKNRQQDRRYIYLVTILWRVIPVII